MILRGEQADRIIIEAQATLREATDRTEFKVQRHKGAWLCTGTVKAADNSSAA